MLWHTFNNLQILMPMFEAYSIHNKVIVIIYVTLERTFIEFDYELCFLFIL
jgi:hypothetical protein